MGSSKQACLGLRKCSRSRSPVLHGRRRHEIEHLSSIFITRNASYEDFVRILEVRRRIEQITRNYKFYKGAYRFLELGLARLEYR